MSSGAGKKAFVQPPSRAALGGVWLPISAGLDACRSNARLPKVRPA